MTRLATAKGTHNHKLIPVVAKIGFARPETTSISLVTAVAGRRIFTRWNDTVAYQKYSAYSRFLGHACYGCPA